ncbi:MAG: hypothetical protein IKQ70_04185 [Bacteroidales bacterium]|nr:hypothetical protein [Bacteroidales bacterium]
MKRILTLALTLGITTAVIAQEDTTSLRKTATEQAKTGEYAAAVTNFAKAISIQEAAGVTDTALYFNAAVSAYKGKDYKNGAKYFDKCIQLGYEKEKCYKFGGACLQNIEDYAQLQSTMTKAIEEFPANTTFKQMLSTSYVGQAKPKLDEANTIIKNAEPLKNSDVEKYNAEIAKAKQVFSEILPTVELAYKTNPENKSAIQLLSVLYGNLGETAKANEMKAKLK